MNCTFWSCGVLPQSSFSFTHLLSLNPEMLSVAYLVGLAWVHGGFWLVQGSVRLEAVTPSPHPGFGRRIITVFIIFYHMQSSLSILSHLSSLSNNQGRRFSRLRDLAQRASAPKECHCQNQVQTCAFGLQTESCFSLPGMRGSASKNQKTQCRSCSCMDEAGCVDRYEWGWLGIAQQGAVGIVVQDRWAGTLITGIPTGCWDAKLIFFFRIEAGNIIKQIFIKCPPCTRH